MPKIKIFLTLFIILSLFTANVYASLSVHPEQIQETLIIGQNNSTLLHIKNIGPTSILEYQVSASEKWVIIKPIIGEVKVNETADIEINIDVSQLQQGTYNAYIVVSDPHHGPTKIPIEVTVNAITDVNESSENNSLSLMAFPNPFNSSTKINYVLSIRQRVSIDVFDINGNKVKSLVNEIQDEGNYYFQFDATELSGDIYFLTIKTPTISVIKKLFLKN